ncbi:hypothetical protein NDU88_003697 [Pleurodeles waltl]|uniref:Uncharacterized protein n=1 Tax=Pleurodeles waltl TaxID=8319 RepID=A0AAV7LG64_PLEWA|nr:hypothetical protein NDU88_003697 [Pleurodeles waltl]
MYGPRGRAAAGPGSGPPAPSGVPLGHIVDSSAEASEGPGGGVKANSPSTCHQDSAEAAKQEKRTGRQQVEGEEVTQMESGGGRPGIEGSRPSRWTGSDTTRPGACAGPRVRAAAGIGSGPLAPSGIPKDRVWTMRRHS